MRVDPKVSYLKVTPDDVTKAVAAGFPARLIGQKPWLDQNRWRDLWYRWQVDGLGWQRRLVFQLYSLRWKNQRAPYRNLIPQSWSLKEIAIEKTDGYWYIRGHSLVMINE